MSHLQLPSIAAAPLAGDVLQAFFKTSHILHRQFELRLSALDVPAYLSGPRLRFLIAVSESGPIRMSEMAAKLGIQARTVTQFVDALEQEKLLVRLPDPNDRRATFLQVTEIAPPVILHARAAMSTAAAEILGALSEEAQGQLLHILNQLSDVKNGDTTDEQ